MESSNETLNGRTIPLPAPNTKTESDELITTGSDGTALAKNKREVSVEASTDTSIEPVPIEMDFSDDPDTWPDTIPPAVYKVLWPPLDEEVLVQEEDLPQHGSRTISEIPAMTVRYRLPLYVNIRNTQVSNELTRLLIEQVQRDSPDIKDLEKCRISFASDNGRRRNTYSLVVDVRANNTAQFNAIQRTEFKLFHTPLETLGIGPSVSENLLRLDVNHVPGMWYASSARQLADLIHKAHRIKQLLKVTSP